MEHLECLQVSLKLLQGSRGDNRRFSKCFTASSLLHTYQVFNSKAAEVICIPFDLCIFIFFLKQDYLIEVYCHVKLHEDFFGALLFLQF